MQVLSRTKLNETNVDRIVSWNGIADGAKQEEHIFSITKEWLNKYQTHAYTVYNNRNEFEYICMRHRHIAEAEQHVMD